MLYVTYIYISRNTIDRLSHPQSRYICLSMYLYISISWPTQYNEWAMISLSMYIYTCMYLYNIYIPKFTKKKLLVKIPIYPPT